MGGSSGAGGSDAMGGNAGMGMAGASMAAAGSGGQGGLPIPDKLVALTFDDGPDVTLTSAVLDKLEAHGVPASFFLVGQRVTADKQAVLDRAASLGCSFENHSNGFAPLGDGGTATPEQITASVEDTNAAIEALTGQTPVFFRAPNLDVSAQLYELVDLPFAVGIVGGDFSADFGGNPTVEAVSETVLSQVQDGSIVLLHDVQPGLDPQPTPPALDIIIPELQSQGYELVSLRELFERRGVDPTTRQDSPWNVVPPSE